MKISQSKNIKKPLIITTIAIVLIGIAGVGAASYYKVGFFAPKIKDSINLSQPSDNEKEAALEIKKQSLEQSSGKVQTGSDPSPAPEVVEGSDKKSVHAEITAANQDESTLHVRVLIQSVVNSGRCTITMTSSSHNTYTQSVDVQALPSSSTCKGFDIPVGQLGQGTWSITINFSNEDVVASAIKEVVIR
jgi:hypothetical protein